MIILISNEAKKYRRLKSILNKLFLNILRIFVPACIVAAAAVIIILAQSAVRSLIPKTVMLDSFICGYFNGRIPVGCGAVHGMMNLSILYDSVRCRPPLGDHFITLTWLVSSSPAQVFATWIIALLYHSFSFLFPPFFFFRVEKLLFHNIRRRCIFRNVYMNPCEF